MLPDKTVWERVLRWGLWLGYVPAGILVYAFPSPWFELTRFFFMLFGLFMLAWTFNQRTKK